MRTLQEFKNKVETRNSLDKEIREFLYSSKTRNKIKKIINYSGDVAISIVNERLHVSTLTLSTTTSIINGNSIFVINFSELFEN